MSLAGPLEGMEASISWVINSLNQVCCSRFGFCGTTQEFCGDAQIASPSCAGGQSAQQKTIAYYEGWAITRGCDVMLPGESQNKQLATERTPFERSSMKLIAIRANTTRVVHSREFCVCHDRPCELSDRSDESIGCRAILSAHRTQVFLSKSSSLDIDWWLVHERS